MRMGSQKQRDQRQPVILNARLRTPEGWSDITIGNLSPRGLMAKCSSPPEKGAFVELRCGTHCVVGHVRWTQGQRFGLRSQDRIDIAALLGEQGKGPKPTGVERRSAPREGLTSALLSKAIPDEARSRNLARLFDWSVLALVGIAGAGLVVSQVNAVFSAPMAQVRSALQHHD